jgi:hypothetical protein
MYSGAFVIVSLNSVTVAIKNCTSVPSRSRRYIVVYMHFEFSVSYQRSLLRINNKVNSKVKDLKLNSVTILKNIWLM